MLNKMVIFEIIPTNSISKGSLMQVFKKITAITLLALASMAVQAESPIVPAEYEAKNAALVKEFEAKPTPEGIDGVYLAGYQREDGSGEFGELWSYIDADAGKMSFIANIRTADESRWGKSKHALAMGGDFYFEGAVMKVRNAHGDTILLDGDGAPISVVNDEHFRVHYYDRDGKRQVLDYIKQS